MKTINVKLFMLFLFVTSVTYAQVGYNDYDANRDGGIDQNEFNEGYQNGMSNWDSDGNNYISDREFYDNNFNRMATNRDGNVTQDQWNQTYDNNRYQDYNVNRDFNTMDSNRDGNLDNDEYYNSMKKSDYYSSFDANRDNRVDKNEFNQGIFKQSDRNQDGRLSKNEYEGFNSTYNGTSGITELETTEQVKIIDNKYLRK